MSSKDASAVTLVVCTEWLNLVGVTVGRKNVALFYAVQHLKKNISKR